MQSNTDVFREKSAKPEPSFPSSPLDSWFPRALNFWIPDTIKINKSPGVRLFSRRKVRSWFVTLLRGTRAKNQMPRLVRDFSSLPKVSWWCLSLGGTWARQPTSRTLPNSCWMQAAFGSHAGKTRGVLRWYDSLRKGAWFGDWGFLRAFTQNIDVLINLWITRP